MSFIVVFSSPFLANSWRATSTNFCLVLEIDMIILFFVCFSSSGVVTVRILCHPACSPSDDGIISCTCRYTCAKVLKLAESHKSEPILLFFFYLFLIFSVPIGRYSLSTRLLRIIYIIRIRIWISLAIIRPVSLRLQDEGQKKAHGLHRCTRSL